MNGQEARALVERAKRNRGPSVILSGGDDVTLPKADMDALLSLAAVGAAWAGATEAWCVLPHDNMAAQVFPTSLLAKQATIRGPRDSVRRVLIAAEGQEGSDDGT